MSFKEVVCGDLPVKEIYSSEEFFDENALFLKRVLGNPQPDNKALGALVLDSEQADMLLNIFDVLKRIDKNVFNEEGNRIALNISKAIDELSLVLRTVKMERVVK